MCCFALSTPNCTECEWVVVVVVVVVVTINAANLHIRHCCPHLTPVCSERQMASHQRAGALCKSTQFIYDISKQGPDVLQSVCRTLRCFSLARVALAVEVKERIELYLYSTSGPSWPVVGRNLPLFTSCCDYAPHASSCCFSIHF
jgi:hypothetical protein